MNTRQPWRCQRHKTKGCSVDELPDAPPVMDFTSSTFAAENRAFSLLTALSSSLLSLSIPPLPPLPPSITRRLVYLLHLQSARCRAAIFPRSLVFTLFPSILPRPCKRRMTHVCDPYKETHLLSADPILSLSLLLVFPFFSAPLVCARRPRRTCLSLPFFRSISAAGERSPRAPISSHSSGKLGLWVSDRKWSHLCVILICYS